MIEQTITLAILVRDMTHNLSILNVYRRGGELIVVAHHHQLHGLNFYMAFYDHEVKAQVRIFVDKELPVTTWYMVGKQDESWSCVTPLQFIASQYAVPNIQEMVCLYANPKTQLDVIEADIVRMMQDWIRKINLDFGVSIAQASMLIDAFYRDDSLLECMKNVWCDPHAQQNSDDRLLVAAMQAAREYLLENHELPENELASLLKKFGMQQKVPACELKDMLRTPLSFFVQSNEAVATLPSYKIPHMKR